MSRLPLPIHLPVARLRASQSVSSRVRHATDALHAVIKYVALVRLTDWDRLGFPAPGKPVDAPVTEILDAPSANHWWALGARLGALDGAWAPATPQWRRLGPIADLANRGRRYRHYALSAPADPELADALEDGLDRLLTSAAAVLALPLVHTGAGGDTVLEEGVPAAREGELRVICPAGGLVIEPWVLLLDPDREGARRDVFVYERLTGAGALYGSADALRSLFDVPPVFDTLRGWLRSRRREAALASLGDDPAVAEPGRASELARRALARELERVRAGAPDRVPRLALEAALDAPWGDGSRVLVLDGSSGVGKTREAAAWLQREQDRGRLPILVRALQWAPDDALEDRIAAALTGAVVPLDPARLVAPNQGLSLAVDGVNEAADPAATLASLGRAVSRLPSGTRLLVSTRSELLAATMRALPPARMALVHGGIVALGPLSRAEARSLWRQAEARGAPSWSRLGPPTRRLVQYPLLGALAVELGALGTSATTSLDAVIEAYVQSRSTGRSRLLLRHVAARMWAERADRLSLGSEPSPLLATAVSGEGRLTDAWDALLSEGLVVTVHSEQGVGLRLGHDRIAQWSLSFEAELALAGSTPAELAERVAGSAVLQAALGTALARQEREVPTIRALLDAPVVALRALGMSALEALAIQDPEGVDSIVAVWWRSRSMRPVLVEAGARAGVASLLSQGLLHAPTADAAHRHLSRLVLVDPDLLADVLRRALNGLPRWPLWRPRQVRSLALALLLARAGASGRLAEEPALVQLTSELGVRILGTGRSRWGRVSRRVAVALLTLLFPLGRLTPPANWPSWAVELDRMVRRPPAERRDLTALLDLMEGRCGIEDVRGLLLEVAAGGEVIETAVLERALIAAGGRDDQVESLGPVCEEVAAAARHGDGAPTMAAQGVLYVLSTWLARNPGHARWDALRDGFDRTLQGWLACAPDRRWRSASGRWTKALFLAARLGLDELDGTGRGAALSATLWERALRTADQALAADIIDDLHILAATTGVPFQALNGLRPVVDSEVLPDWLEEPLAPLLVSLRSRSAGLLEDALSGEAGARTTLREWLARAPEGEPAGFDLAINFDALLVTRPALTLLISRVLRRTLRMRSVRGMISFLLKVAANRITAEALFPEAEA